MHTNAVRLLFIAIFSVALSGKIDGQVVSYNAGGHKMRSSGEKIQIIVNKLSDVKNKGGSNVSLPGLIGSVISLSINVVKGIAANQVSKYTAQYSVTKSESELIWLTDPTKPNSTFINIDSINIVRIVLAKDFRQTVASDIVLVPISQSNTGLFRFKISRLFLPLSKAKIKAAGKVGNMLDLNIEIKMDVIYPEAASGGSGDSSKQGNTIARASSGGNNLQNKSITIGQSSITISSVSPGGDIPLDGQDCFSGWFQLPPMTSLKFADNENSYKIGVYTLTVTVKEANPHALKAKALSDFFSNNSSNIGELLKQFFPSSSK